MASPCEMTSAGFEWTRGNYPRSFAVGPTTRFLDCCNQRAENVTVFRTGAQTPCCQ
jgi:6-phosphogluconolactonase